MFVSMFIHYLLGESKHIMMSRLQESPEDRGRCFETTGNDSKTIIL